MNGLNDQSFFLYPWESEPGFPHVGQCLALKVSSCRDDIHFVRLPHLSHVKQN